MKEKSFAGVDCHKNTIACSFKGQTKEYHTTPKGFSQALKWTGNNSYWAVEGAYHYGLTFSSFLISKGFKVYEFNALRTANARKVYSISGGKTDFIDAQIIAKIAPDVKLQEVSLNTIELKRKITQRELFVKQRTEVINNLKACIIQTGIQSPYKYFVSKKSINWLLNHQDTHLKYAGTILASLQDLI